MSDKKVRKVKADVHNIISTTRTNFVKVCLWLVSLVVLCLQEVVEKCENEQPPSF